jgi:ABC-type lipoprotein release transport system permease subunit
MVLFLSSVQTVLFSLQPSLHAASLQPVEALISE